MNTNKPAQVVLLKIQDRTLGVPVGNVREIRGWEPVTPLPGTHAHIMGVLNLRGEVVTVVDLAKRLGFAGEAQTRGGVVIVVEHDGKLCGLLCESVSDIAESAPGQLQPVPAHHGDEAFLTGLLVRDDAIVGLLDLTVTIGETALAATAKAA